MNTTNLFVELIVIGLGALLWLLILLAVFIGPEDSHKLVNYLLDRNATLIALISLPIIYVLGIIVDRFSDILLQGYESKMRNLYFPNSDDVIDAKTTIYYKSATVSSLMDYNRSRLRICRGWFLNSLFFVIVGVLQIILSPYFKEYLMLSVFFFIFAILNFLVWKRMTKQEYQKLHWYSGGLKRI